MDEVWRNCDDSLKLLTIGEPVAIMRPVILWPVAASATTVVPTRCGLTECYSSRPH